MTSQPVSQPVIFRGSICLPANQPSDQMSTWTSVSSWCSSCHAMSLHPLSISSIPRHKICKKFNMSERYRPLKFQMCIEMTGKCKPICLSKSVNFPEIFFRGYIVKYTSKTFLEHFNYLPSAITYHPLPLFLDTTYARNKIIPLPVFLDKYYARNEIFILRVNQPASQPTSHLMKCQPNPKSDPGGRVRLTFC